MMPIYTKALSMTRKQFFIELEKTKEGLDYIKYLKSHGIQRDQKHERGYEIHHIHPKSLGGKDSKRNLLKLSIYDHVVAHYLLALAIPCDKTIAALYYMSNRQVKTLSDIEQVQLKELKNWSNLREQGQKRLQQRRVEKTTPEVRARQKATCISRYGNICGAMHTPERKAKAIKHSLESRNRIYGANGAGAMHTEKAKQRRKESFRKTMEDRYEGKAMTWCHTNDVQRKAFNSRIQRYGTLNGNMMTPEACAKRESGKRRKMTVVRTPEFEQWFQETYGRTGKKRSWVVTEFLTTMGKTLEEYPEYLK